MELDWTHYATGVTTVIAAVFIFRGIHIASNDAMLESMETQQPEEAAKHRAYLNDKSWFWRGWG